MKILIVSSLNPELLPDGETWLVIGPCCWGRSRSLPIALENAESMRAYVEGTFTARVIPSGALTIHDDGRYQIEGWTKEQQEHASVTSRVVAVTKTAVQKWGKEAAALAKAHRKELKP